MKPGATTVPLVDLRASFAPIRDEVFRAFDEVFASMDLLDGPNLRAFEREFAAYCETPHGVAVSSGTSALFAALVACGVGAGDEVIVPSHTFFATIEAVIHTGAIPVLVDVEPERLTIDVEAVREALTPATRAILPVHLYGHPAEMDVLCTLARERGLCVVEDAAQAHGARYRGARCGGIGDAAAFSFYFTKNLAAVGEGGFVATGRDDVAEGVRRLRHHGHVSKFEHAIVGYNLRMDELQAAVLRIRLRRLDAALARRRAIAAHYDARFADGPVRPLSPRRDCEAAHHLYPVRVAKRDELIAHLGEHGIGTGIHYRKPALGRHPHRVGSMKVTDEACAELLSLPIYPELSDEQVEYVASHLLDFYERGRGAG
jgi:dTDP-4-amino-4,6-dideoxygalactose transaminase